MNIGGLKRKHLSLSVAAPQKASAVRSAAHRREILFSFHLSYIVPVLERESAISGAIAL